MPVAPLMQGAMPLMPVLSAQEVQAAEESKSHQAAAALAGQAIKSQLLAYVQSCFSDSQNARQQAGVTDNLVNAQRRRKGEYDATRLAELAKFSIKPFWVPLTQIKCNAAEAWMRDILLPYGEKIWTLKPTVEPEVPETRAQIARVAAAAHVQAMTESGQQVPAGGLQQILDDMIEAEKDELRKAAMARAKAMETRIEDQLSESAWPQVFQEFLSNAVTFGTGFLKGPVIQRVKRRHWADGAITVDYEPFPTVQAPSPHDMYPSPWSVGVEDGYIIERIKTYRSGLEACIGVENYLDNEITALLAETPADMGLSQSNLPGDDQRAASEQKALGSKDVRIECFEFWGPVPGFLLADAKLPGQDFQPGRDYEVQIIWSRDHILKVMPNWSDLGTRPYFKAVYKRIPGSFWGVGVPMLMISSQDRANGSMVAMLHNMSWASGPMAWVDVTRLVEKGDALTWHPGKVLQTTNEMGLTVPPAQWYTVPSNASELMAIYNQAVADSDNESGVPAYTYGSDRAAGAATTFSGLTALMNSAARGIKDAFAEVDTNGVGPLISNWVDWLNKYDPDDNIKGDVKVITTGATGLFVKELQMQKLTEFMDRTNNPVDLSIIGLKGRAKLLRKMADQLKMADFTELIPSDKELDARERQQKEEAAALAASKPNAGGANTMGTVPRAENMRVPIEG